MSYRCNELTHIYIYILQSLNSMFTIFPLTNPNPNENWCVLINYPS